MVKYICLHGKLYLFKLEIVFVQIGNYICLTWKFWSLAVSWVSGAGRKADNHSRASQSDHSSTKLSLQHKYKYNSKHKYNFKKYKYECHYMAKNHSHV